MSRPARPAHALATPRPEVLADPSGARDPRSDVYSLGALAVFCLTGHDPAAVPNRCAGRPGWPGRSAPRPGPRASGSHRRSRICSLLRSIPTRRGGRPTYGRGGGLTAVAAAPAGRARRHHRTAGRATRRRGAVVPAAVAGAVALVVAAALIASRPDGSGPSTTDTGSGVVGAPAGTGAQPSTGTTAGPAPATTRSGTDPGSARASQPVPASAPTPSTDPDDQQRCATSTPGYGGDRHPGTRSRRRRHCRPRCSYDGAAVCLLLRHRDAACGPRP